MKKSSLKNAIRDITSTLNRFIAILAITALGAGFYSGLNLTGPSMRQTANKYYHDTKLMDYRVLSSMGFTDDDLDAIKELGGVDVVMPAYTMDYTVEHRAASLVIRFHSLPESLDSDDYLNQLTLVEGRMPQNDNECVIGTSNYEKDDNDIGTVIKIESDNTKTSLDMIREREFTVVGIVQSPLYISHFLGTSNIGNGSLANFVFVNNSAFDSEFYHEIYITSTPATEVFAFSDDYEDITEIGAKELESLGDERVVVRYDEIYSKASEALEDARKELADGRKELEDGKKEADEKLAEAAAELDDAERKISDGKKEIASGEAEIASNEKKLNDSQAEIDKNSATLKSSRNTLNAKQKEYDTGLAEYNKNYAEYNSKKSDYDSALANVSSLQSGVNAMPAMLSAMEASLAGLPPSVPTPLPEAVTTFNSSLNGILQTSGGVAALLNAYGDTSGLASSINSTIAAVQAVPQDENYYTTAYSIVNSGINTSAMQAALGGVESSLLAQKPALDEAAAQLAAAKAVLDSGKSQLDSGWTELKAGESQLAAAQKLVADGKAQLASAKTTLNNFKQELADGEVELLEGREEYEKQKEDALKEIADAEKELKNGEKEIRDAEKKLADLEEPKWYVFNRANTQSFSSFRSDSDRISSIATVITPFFFLVAALVCLTTMTRMVEEQRTQIGTKKALGFSKPAIAFKYIFYAGAASTLGAFIGIFAAGVNVFPTVIWNAYRMMYAMPELYMHDYAPTLVFTVLISVFCVTAAAVAASLSALKASPADLMRPKAPKPGKRVFLEHIPFLWNKMKFSLKVTARNIFRNKQRFLMTILGILGCMSLLVVGFGLNDAISGISEIQFGELNHQDIEIALSKPSIPDANTTLNKILNDAGDSLYIQQTNINVTKIVSNKKEKGTNLDVQMRVLDKNPEGFIDFRERRTHKPVEFPETDGVLLTEKLAKQIDARAGDTIHLETTETDGTEKTANFTVRGVVENYIDHNVFMSSETYEEAFNEMPEYTNVELELFEEEEGRAQTLEKILGDSNVAIAYDISTVKDSVSDMLESLDSVIWLIIICAAMLAFVVLYNLTNINITERAREMATLKVLGFYDGEVAFYIFRENIFLTIIGIILGLFGGFALFTYVITVAEIDNVMFGRSISFVSYALSVAFTAVVSWIVNVFMLRKIRKIDMVESLKAGE